MQLVDDVPALGHNQRRRKAMASWAAYSQIGLAALRGMLSGCLVLARTCIWKKANNHRASNMAYQNHVEVSQKDHRFLRVFEVRTGPGVVSRALI